MTAAVVLGEHTDATRLTTMTALTTVLALVALASMAPACGRTSSAPSASDDEPPGATRPTAISENPPESPCITLRPMSEQARSEGIHALVHQPAGGAHDAPASPTGARADAADEVVVVSPADSPSGAWVTIPGVVPRDRAPLSQPWSLHIGADTPLTASSTPAWLRPDTDDDGERVTATAPPELVGAVLRLAGEDARGDTLWRTLAFGERGAANLRRYESAYVPWRVASRPQASLPDDLRADVAGYEVELVALIEHDLDGDGGLELVVFAVDDYLDAAGDVVTSGGHLGVMWSTGKPAARSDGQAIAATPLALDEGTVFPALHVVPAALTGGQPLLVSARACCGGTSIDAIDIALGALIARPRQLAEGERAVCLYPGSTRPTRSTRARVTFADSSSRPR